MDPTLKCRHWTETRMQAGAGWHARERRDGGFALELHALAAVHCPLNRLARGLSWLCLSCEIMDIGYVI